MELLHNQMVISAIVYVKNSILEIYVKHTIIHVVTILA